MGWTTVGFGKHSGKSLPQIMFKDADWFFHGYESGYFKEGALAHEAHELYRRARSVRVPPRNGHKMLVEYVTHRDVRSGREKFATMRLIADGPGLERLNVSPSIDFYTPRAYARNDKAGNKYFVTALKAILFGNRSQRMNRRACEAFFNDDDNFDL